LTKLLFLLLVRLCRVVDGPHSAFPRSKIRQRWSLLPWQRLLPSQ